MLVRGIPSTNFNVNRARQFLPDKVRDAPVVAPVNLIIKRQEYL